MRLMVQCFLAGCALSLVLLGCSKKPSDTEAAKAETTPSASAASVAAETSSLPSASAPSLAPPPAAANTPPPAPAVIPPEANTDAMLGILTQALRRYSAEKQRVPATLSEVVAAGYVQTMPQPPPGKRFVVDKRRVVVVLQ